jgi:hypothetical protein
MRNPRQTLRKAIMAAAAAAVMTGVLTASTGSGAQASVQDSAQASAQDVYTFVPIRLTVTNIQDDDVFPWTDWQDEPHMYYGGAEWAGLAQRGGVDISGMDPVDFTGATISVDLWERDRNWTDNEHLGFATASTSQLDQELELKFQGNWWDYRLTYKVVRK